jgi:hypothetical protein
MTVHCTDHNLTYAQIRHLVLEEAAQAILEDTFEYNGKTFLKLGAAYFANKLRQMRHEEPK